MEVIHINNKIICIKQDNYETREMFYDRVWIIINNINKYDNNIDKLICLSKMWKNIKYLNCKYNIDNMQEIALLKFYV